MNPLRRIEHFLKCTYDQKYFVEQYSTAKTMEFDLMEMDEDTIKTKEATANYLLWKFRHLRRWTLRSIVWSTFLTMIILYLMISVSVTYCVIFTVVATLIRKFYFKEYEMSNIIGDTEL